MPFGDGIHLVPPQRSVAPYLDHVAAQRRIESRSVKVESGCWDWQGYLSDGYGSVTIEGRPMAAHRASLIAFGRPLESGQLVDHLCSNRRCVNPEHLEPVTHAENTRRGPYGRARGCRKHGFEDGYRYYYGRTDQTGQVMWICVVCHPENRGDAQYLAQMGQSHS